MVTRFSAVSAIGLVAVILSPSGLSASTVNNATSSRARFLKWKSYKYSVILALGVGPDDLKTPLSASSKLNVDSVARPYFDKQAPIIVVTGANVHSRGTDYYDAVEMQKH